VRLKVGIKIASVSPKEDSGFMKFKVFALAMGASCMLLAGCNSVSDGVVRANSKIQTMVYDAAGRVQSWTDPEQYERTQANVPDTRYCYKSLGDIVCYNAPQPNMSNPLFGSQGYAAAAMPAVQHVQMMPELKAIAVPVTPVSEPQATAKPKLLAEPKPLMSRF
jgi:YD repeat-containing protein